MSGSAPTPRFVTPKGYVVDAGGSLGPITFDIKKGTDGADSVLIRQDGFSVAMRRDRVEAFIWAMRETVL